MLRYLRRAAKIEMEIEKVERESMMDNANLSPRTIPLQSALVRYEKTLAYLNGSQPTLSSKKALEILSARDELQDVLKTTKPVPVELLSQLIQLDLCLRQKAEKILKALNLPECRESLSVTPQDWWWYLDSKQANWLIRWLTIIAWTGSLGLLANIASRFFSGGVGALGAAAVIFPSFLTLLQARSELTEAGRTGFEQLLVKIHMPHSCHEKAKLGSLLALFGLMLSFWATLPLISQFYNQEGYNNSRQGQLGIAKENYLRAIALNPNNTDAHYNLGNLYEDLQQFDKASRQYLIAVKGDLPEAYNNLARLLIQKKEYSQAVALLNQGLQKLDENTSVVVKYNLYKNLGWARFQQGRDIEAEQALQAAASIASTPEVTKSIPNRGSAHCLLAQVLERQKQPSAVDQWQQCCQLGSTLNPDEDNWLYIAHKKLQEAGQSCQKT